MKAFQLIMAVITILMVAGMFGFNIWINANFSKGLAVPQCYMGMNIITSALVLVTIILLLIKK